MATVEPRIRSIDLDENQEPEQVTIILPVRHAAEVMRVLGKLLPSTSSNQFTNDVYRCLEVVFNKFYDDGVSEYLRGKA